MTVVFNLSCLWWGSIRGLWILPDGSDWLKGKLSLVLTGRVMLSKSLIQFFVDMELCSLPVIYLGWNMVEIMKIMVTSFKWSQACNWYTQCPQPCSRPPVTHASTGDSWTHPGKSGSVSCWVTAPFSWVLMHTRFYLCPPSVYFPVLCKFLQLCCRG